MSVETLDQLPSPVDIKPSQPLQSRYTAKLFQTRIFPECLEALDCGTPIAMASTPSAALLVSTSWNTASDDLTSPPTRILVKDFCENALKSDQVSRLYCTVLDVEVSEDQKKDAESVGVTLIQATRSKWSNPDEDPAGVNWLFNHNMYYPQLSTLQGVKHVVSFSPKIKNAATAIHESLFPQATLHQLSVPTPPGVVFAFDAWSRYACGLTGFHRSLMQDFFARKAEAGEYLKAYSTVVDVELSTDQIQDAEKCGVILIKAERQKGVDDTPNIGWLMYHYSHFPDLQKLQNIKYVVGYAPKTGWAAIDIQKKLFPGAKLVLINHVCQEQNCVLVKDEFSELDQEMLQMASQADLLFSIGPHLYDHFKNAYRAVINGKKLYDIPHKEILPKPRQQYFVYEKLASQIEIDAHTILTYGQLNTAQALKRCDSIAASIGSVANKYKTPLEWNIHGVSEHTYEGTETFLVEKLKSGKVTLKPYKHHSAETLLQSLRQSHLCLPPLSYTDYSFEGLEAMAAGLPTAVQGDTHIAAMIERHFEDHKDYCVVGNETEELTSKIIANLSNFDAAFQQASLLKEALAESQAVTESLARFANSLGVENDEGSSKPLTEQVKELTKKLRSTEQALVSHQIESSMKKERLQSELEEKNKMFKELRDRGEKALEESQSKFEIEKSTLESQLKEAKGEKATLETRCKELTKKLENTEQSLVSQRIGNSLERDKLQSELEEKKKLIKDLEDKVAELEHKFEGHADGKRGTLSTASEGEKETRAIKRQRSDSGEMVEEVGPMKPKVQRLGNTDGDTAIETQEGAACTEEDNDLQSRPTTKQNEVEKLQQINPVNVLKQKAINNLLDELENSYECMERKGDCRNIWLIADEERHFYKLPSGFQLEVPPNAVEESRRLVVTTNNHKRPPLKDYEYYESDVLEFERHISFKQPVYISRPNLNVDSSERIQVILRSNDGSKWEELKSVRAEGKIKVEVTHFSRHTAISRPVHDVINISKEGGKWSSSANNQVCLEVPENAVEHPRKFILELRQSETEEIADNATVEECFHVSFSPVIYFKEEQASNNVFKKSVTLSLPLPPPIPRDDVDNSEVCILKDEAGNCEWQNITGHCTYDIQEPVLKITTQSLSGYSIGRCRRDRISTLSQTLSEITKMNKGGTRRVKFVLMQHQKDLCTLRCDILESKTISKTVESPANKKCPTYTNKVASGDELINPGDVIRNAVTSDFVLTTRLNQRTYYPSIDNHWDVKVATLSAQNTILTSGMMQFNRGINILCELPFFISKEQNNSATVGNAITDSTSSITNRCLAPLNVLFVKMNRMLSDEQRSCLLALLRGHQIPKGDVDKMNTSLKIFQHLEDTGYISEKKVDLLEEMFEALNYNDVKQLVKKYQLEHMGSSE